jgi:ABC-type transport system involved in multi-copper enzyme maturation permease subunit
MWSIAWNTFREILRDRILFVILLFGLLLIGSTLVLEKISYDTSTKLVLDFGLSFITFFLIIITFFTGSSLLLREIEQKTILLLFAKPIPRRSFILGKFLGIALILFCIFLGFSLFFWLTLSLKGLVMTYALAQALVLIYIESLFALSMLLFFSSLTSPMITIFSSLMLFLAGTSMPFLNEFLRRQDGSFLEAFSWLYYLVPNFGIFQIGDAAAYGITLTLPAFLVIIGYGVLYSGLFLFLTTLIIHRKEV